MTTPSNLDEAAAHLTGRLATSVTVGDEARAAIVAAIDKVVVFRHVAGDVVNKDIAEVAAVLQMLRQSRTDFTAIRNSVKKAHTAAVAASSTPDSNGGST